jgi:hypothetical protein
MLAEVVTDRKIGDLLPFELIREFKMNENDHFDYFLEEKSYIPKKISPNLNTLRRKLCFFNSSSEKNNILDNKLTCYPGT